MSDDAPALRLERVEKVFHGPFVFPRVRALAPLSLALPGGRVLGLIGPNGSGKTTALRCALGLLSPTRGTVRIFGERPGSAAARGLVGYAPERFEPTRGRSASATLELLAALSGLPRREGRLRSAALLEEVDLGHAASRPVGALSKGMKRRLAIAQALLGEPRLLVLDEPFDGLDPPGTLLVREEILRRAKEGAAVVVSSHQLADVEAVATDLVVLDRGEVLAQGALGAVLDRPGAARLEVAGLDDDGLLRLAEAARSLGGEVVARGPARESLESLFARLVRGRR